MIVNRCINCGSRVFDDGFCGEINCNSYYSQWDKTGAPAQEEKEMERDGVHTGGIKPDEPMQLPPSVGNRLVPGFLPRPEEAAEKRAADSRQLHRDAAVAALSGLCANVKYLSPVDMSRDAIRVADEFVRQYNPDAVIAEAMG